MSPGFTCYFLLQCLEDLGRPIIHWALLSWEILPRRMACSTDVLALKCLVWPKPWILSGSAMSWWRHLYEGGKHDPPLLVAALGMRFGLKPCRHHRISLAISCLLRRIYSLPNGSAPVSSSRFCRFITKVLVWYSLINLCFFLYVDFFCCQWIVQALREQVLGNSTLISGLL